MSKITDAKESTRDVISWLMQRPMLFAGSCLLALSVLASIVTANIAYNAANQAEAATDAVRDESVNRLESSCRLQRKNVEDNTEALIRTISRLLGSDDEDLPQVVAIIREEYGAIPPPPACLLDGDGQPINGE